MSRIAVQSTFTLPTRAEIVSRLATSPPIEELLTSDDLERQQEISKAGGKPAAVLLLVVNHPTDPTVIDGLPVIFFIQPARLSGLPSNSASQKRRCEP